MIMMLSLMNFVSFVAGDSLGWVSKQMDWVFFLRTKPMFFPSNFTMLVIDFKTPKSFLEIFTPKFCHPYQMGRMIIWYDSYQQTFFKPKVVLSYKANMLDTFLNTSPQLVLESNFLNPQHFKPGSLRMVFKFYLKMLFYFLSSFWWNLKSLDSLSTTSLSKHQLCKFQRALIFNKLQYYWRCNNCFHF